VLIPSILITRWLLDGCKNKSRSKWRCFLSFFLSLIMSL
jgi:hypothetical protein